MKRVLSCLLVLCLLASAAVCAAGEGAPAPSADGPDWDLTPLPDAWFDDAVFLGDSISFTLEKQCEATGELGEALFMNESSFNVRSAVWGYLQLWYQGNTYTPEDVLPLTGAKKAFFMLGINDVGQDGGIEQTMELWEELIANIRETCPDLQIFLQSCLPMYYASEYETLNNDIINEYNAQLRAFCEENGLIFVDLADYFRDETGGVAERFTSDHYVHINFDAAALWVEQLKNPANYSVDPRSV